MLVNLYKNSLSRMWQLTACGLNDPGNWSRFTPMDQSGSSDRYRFDAVIAAVAGGGLILRPIKRLQKLGTASYEYDWQSGEDDVIAHALEVAEQLGVELQLSEPVQVA